MKSYFGPYVRTSATDKWHWKEACPNFPKVGRIESMVSTVTPDPIELCNFCANMDNVKIAYDVTERNRIINNIHNLTDRQLSNNRMINEDIRKENLNIDDVDYKSKKQN